MRAEVPDDADVGLVQAQVDPAHRDEVDVAELSGLDQVADQVDGRAVEEGVARHRARGRARRRARRARSASCDEAASGFSTKTCLPASSARERERVVGADRRRERDRLDRRVVEHARRRSVVAADARVAPRRSRSSASLVAGRRRRRARPRAAPAGSGRGSAPSSRGRRRRREPARRRRCRSSAVIRPRLPAKDLGGVRSRSDSRGPATSRGRRRRPCRAPPRGRSARAPSTCQSPVMPCGTWKRSKWCWLEALRLVGEARPRADERHVAAQHVDRAAAARRGSSCAASRRTA